MIKKIVEEKAKKNASRVRKSIGVDTSIVSANRHKIPNLITNIQNKKAGMQRYGK